VNKMAESNAAQVILTDDGLKIIKAQNTADEAVGNVNDINSDNKLTPSEKLKLKQEYDKDVELYNIDIEQLKSVDLPTAELETAMSNLTDFVTPLFKEMNRTSTVDRDALDSVFTAFATADKNASQAFVNMVQQVADDAKKAGDDAKQAGEEAQEAGQEAKASAEQAKTDATQAKADAATAQQKAQSSIDQLNEASTKFNGEITEAKNSAQQALGNITVVDSKVEKLSTSTTAQFNTLNNGYQEVISSVNNMDIGATNLLKNSKFDDKMNGWRNWCPQGMGTSTVEINPTGGGGDWPRQAIYLAKIINPEADKNNQFGIAQDNVPVEPNAEYTFQLFNDGADPITVQHGNGSNDPYVTKVLGGHRTTWTFKIPADVYNTNIYIGFNSGQSGTAWISLTKLEKGNKATDWSPAPEDLATATEFDQISDALKLTAKQTDMTKALNSITTLTETASGLQTQVNSKAGQSQVTQLADQYQAVVGSMTGSSLVPNSGYPIDTKHWVIGGTKGDFNALPHGFYHNSKDNVFMLRNLGAQPTLECYVSSDRFPVKPNTQYSLSFKGFASRNVPSMDVWFLGRKYSSTSSIGYDQAISIVDKKVLSPSQVDTIQAVFNTGDCEEGYIRFDNNGSTDGKDSALFFTEVQVNAGTIAMPWSAPTLSQADITASIDNIHLGVKNADGSTSTFNMNGNTILMDTAQTIINGNTSIQNGTIGTAKIANAAINTAQIADGAINNAKIANAAINDAKISNLNGNKIVAGSITANKIDVNDLIANGINTKTLTSVNLNTSTLTTPQLNLGLNGTFTESFDYTQPTTMFLPKKNKGNLTFNHGVLQSEGNMQTYVNGQWGGMNDNLVFQSGINNAQWTEVAPGYIKLDLYKQNGTDIAQRTYSDPTGFYYTSTTGNKSYLGNVLQTGQVQSGSIIGKYIGPMDGELRLQIGNNGDHYGLQVGSYAGSEAVLSDFIYSFTSSNSSNVRIADSGRLMRTTSASKYKYNIKNPDIEETLGDRLLNVRMATWNDKRAVDLYAEELNTGEEREKITIDKYYGLIAEQLRDAGLDMFVDYGKNHEIEGIQYDRAWIPLLSVVRRLNDKVNEYELRLSKLEGTNK
jgi:F0F1-type ATP synthase membrane subunit b/b'